MRAKAKSFYEWVKLHEWQLSSLALVAGFIFDNLTLRRVDLFLENLVFALYLAVVAGGLFLLNIIDGRQWRGRVVDRVRALVPLVIQFALGNLFSGYFVFYSRSAALATSWPFLLLLVAMLIGNEVLKKHYARLTFQMSVFFLALFSFTIFHVPVVLGRIGPEIFILSGAASLVIMAAFILVLSWFIPRVIQRDRRALGWAIGGIFLLINIFYFTNILPPIPLSLKAAGIYHQLGRTTTGYSGRDEVRSWLKIFSTYPVYHFQAGETAYAFSAVFAPTKLNTSVVHRWQHYNEQTSEWETASLVSFPVVGGRDGGYRGYSLKEGLTPGWWRVDVETPRGQLIGRVKFKVVPATVRPVLAPPELL